MLLTKAELSKTDGSCEQLETLSLWKRYRLVKAAK